MGNKRKKTGYIIRNCPECGKKRITYSEYLELMNARKDHPLSCVMCSKCNTSVGFFEEREGDKLE